MLFLTPSLFCITDSYAELLNIQLFIAKSSVLQQKTGRRHSEFNYTDILRIIGMSPQPLSSRKIEINLTKDPNVSRPYVYPMLEKLLETTSESLPLFVWENFPGAAKCNIRVVRKLNKVFRLGWSFDTDAEDGMEIMDFQKSDKDRRITIEYGRTSKVLIERDAANGNAAILTHTYFDGRTGMRRKKYRLTITKTHGMHYVSVDLEARLYPIRYLDVVLKQEPKDFAEEVEMYDKANSRNWRYVLNVRGLVRYVLGEIAIQNETGRKHNARIGAMLKNLSLHYTDRFPFLLHYDDFRQEYRRLEELGKRTTLYEVEVLKVIASELQYLVHTADLEYLKYYVTQRYSEEITRYFYRSLQSGLIRNMGRLRYETLRDYEKNTLHVVMNYLKEEIKSKKQKYAALFV
jgi:hypothetical protein